ncbi:MAG: PHP domain-containing protein [Clostridia bacterium]
MDIVADLHTHTNVSHHAVSTFEEMVAGAKRKGHIAIAITNHAKDMPDSAHDWHFGMFRYIPKVIEGIFIIGGGEANIRNDGSIDLTKENYVHTLDYVVASMHDRVFTKTDRTDIENAYLKVLENPYVTTLGHIGTPKFKFDYEKIISKCNEHKKIVEINCGSFESRNSYGNCEQILLLCKKHRVPIALSSDAHISYAIGNVEKGIELVEKHDFPLELIVNISRENLKKYFIEYKNIDIFNR